MEGKLGLLGLLVVTGGLVLLLASAPYIFQVPPPEIHIEEQVQPTTWLVDDTVDYESLVFESRHTDTQHSLPNNPRAQEIVTEVLAVFNGGDPNKLRELICKIVEMNNGKTYYSIWKASASDPAIGSVSVYSSDGVWLTAFDNKYRNVFEYGTPRGSKSWSFKPCDQLGPPPLALP